MANMTIFDWAALAALAYFGSAAPAQIKRFYRAGRARYQAELEIARLRGRGTQYILGWWATALPAFASSVVWHCIPAATIYGIGLIFAS